MRMIGIAQMTSTIRSSGHLERLLDLPLQQNVRQQRKIIHQFEM